jgi:hypothetical protein
MTMTRPAAPLSADDLMAALGPGYRDWIDPAFQPALSRLCEAISSESRLTEDGERAVRAALLRALTAQAEIRQFAAAHPELAEVPLGPVVVITGLHRSGTTLLQNLLAEHPRLRAPRLWELMSPVAADVTRAWAQARQYISAYYRDAPDFRAIHELDADRPEECHRLSGNCFYSEIYGMRYRVPGYLDWLATQDHTPSYQFHRTQLQAILWRRPGGPVVLKCPLHLWHTDALAAVYPQALVVRLHRDPAQAVPSGCSMVTAIRRARSERVDLAEIGRFWLGRIDEATALLQRQGPDAASGLPVLDIRYPDLMRDPVGTAARVCDFAQAEMTAQAADRMRDWVARSRSAPARHQYAAEDFGLDAGELRLRFRRYRDQYDL